MKREAANDNKPSAVASLDRLPLFATDQEIAVAIVGKGRAEAWRRGTLPILEARGFPRVDALHNGRPVPLIKKYYDSYLGVNASYVSTGASVPEDPEAWTTSPRSRRLRRRD